MGVAMEDIRITAADTGLTPLDSGTKRSGITVRAGMRPTWPPMSPAPAIIKAIYDAIGVDFKELPVTPDQILERLKKQDK